MSDKIDQSAFDIESGVPVIKPEMPEVPDHTPPIEGDIRPKPKFSDRLSKKLIGAVVLFVSAIAVVFLVSIDAMDDKNKPKEKKEPEFVIKKADETNNSNVPREFLNADDDGKLKVAGSLVRPDKPKEIPGTEKTGTMFPDASKTGEVVPSINERGNRTGEASGIPRDTRGGKGGPMTVEEKEAEQNYQIAMQIKQERAARMQKARTSGMVAVAYDLGGNNGTAQLPVQQNPQSSSSGDVINALRNINGGSAGGLPPQAGQTGEQDEKLGFIKDSRKDDNNYHPYRPNKAISKNEIKVGSIIPLALNQGINSDLPGQITARVTEAVYDTVSGCRLLIPAMTTAIGKYDSKVSAGQERMLVVWNALVFPNGDELNLAGMQGYDTGGYAGLESDVDNHFLKLFGLALGMSTVTTVVQMSVPQQNNSGNTVQNPGQILQNSLAQQYGNLGAQVIGKYLAVQPTLRNYPGERFMITVPHTIIFDKVWRNRCER